MIIVLILILILSVILGVFLIKSKLFYNNILGHFKRCNVIVDGKKGSGKDVLIQKVINSRDEEYYANINYGGKCNLIELSSVSIYPNTYMNFINNKITKVDRTFKENKDIYISDGGIYLPSYMDSTLYKTYPSFPIYYALSRHLYNNNVHVNVQNFSRLWKALREQADFFIHVKRTYKLPFFLVIKCNTYDKYESAIQYLEPLNARLLNKYSKAETDIYNAQHGDIRSGFVIIRKSKIKYNTRAFETLILNGSRLK